MAQTKNLCRAEVHFENVPVSLQKTVGYLFKKDLENTVNAFGRKVLALDFNWATHYEALQGYWGLDRDEYMRIRIHWFLEDWNKHRIVKYKLDENANIVGYLPLLKDSKIWVTGKP